MDIRAKMNFFTKMNNNSLELILHDDVQKLLDNFANVIHAQVLFYNAEGEPLRRGRCDSNCKYCQIVQNELFSVERCLKLDQEKLALCRETGESQVYICHAHLYEAIMPVVSGGELLGYVVFGQIRSTEQLPEDLLKQAKNKINPAKLKQAFRAQPYYSADEMQNLIGLMELLVEYIVRHELITAGGDHLYRAVVKYVENNLTSSKLNLAAVARHVGRSISSLSHFIKKHSGQSFKELVIEKRLQKAEELWKLHPGMGIGEAAEQVGFSDRYYFSRIYKAYRGHSAKQFHRMQKLSDIN